MDLSLIIPIYNTSQWLRPCLDSAIAAIEGIDAEVLLIDDGSTDDSGEIAKEYAGKYPVLKYYYKENGGLSNARNFGIGKACGRYIAFLDSDDMVADHIYRDMLCMAEKNKTPLTICNVTRIKENGAALVATMYQKAFSSPPRAVTSIRQDLNLAYDAAVWNKLILRSFWDKHGLSFTDGSVYEDSPVAFKLHWYADRVSVLHSFGYLYRIHEGNFRSDGGQAITQQSDSVKTLTDKIDREKEVLDFIKERIEEPDARPILIAVQQRILTFSFEIFLLDLYNTNKAFQKEFMIRTGDFLSREISDEALAGMSLYNNLKYRYILSKDLDSLLRLMNHKRLAWRSMPIADLAGRKMLVLPEEIYKTGLTPAAPELQNDIPITKIERIFWEEDTLSFYITVFYSRINVPDIYSQKVGAFLYCEFTAERIDLMSEQVHSPELTEKKGTMICRDDFRVYRYNYDGAGIKVMIDRETLARITTTGKWFLGIRYETCISQGERILRSISPEAKEFMETELKDLVLDDKGSARTVTAKYDLRESFFFEVS